MGDKEGVINGCLECGLGYLFKTEFEQYLNKSNYVDTLKNRMSNSFFEKMF